MRPWRVSPLRYATPSANSDAASRRRHSAIASIFARRLRVAATRSETASSSASSMGCKRTHSGAQHGNDEQGPCGKKSDAADGRDRTQPALAGEHDRVQASGEEQNSREHKPARPFEKSRFGKLSCDDSDRQQAERVVDVVLDARVPYGE